MYSLYWPIDKNHIKFFLNEIRIIWNRFIDTRKACRTNFKAVLKKKNLVKYYL